VLPAELREALRLYEKTLGPQHPRFATSLNNLALVFHRSGNFAAAEPLYQRALNIRRAALVEGHPDIAQSVNNLAELYRAWGKLREAEPLYLEALTICRKKWGERNPHFATCINNCALLYSELGRFAEAEPRLRQALEIRVGALGDVHPDVASSLWNLAAVFVATGRASDSLPLLQQAATIRDSIIGQVFTIGSESQRAAFLQHLRAEYDGFLSVVAKHLKTSLPARLAAIDFVFRRKAIESEAQATQRDAVLGGKYPNLVPQLREWTALRRQIVQKTLAGPGPEGLPAHWQLLAQWDQQKERLEAELARSIPEMNLEQRLRAADRRAVALALPAGMALVEFVRFDVFDFQAVPARGESRWSPARYLAFVLPPGSRITCR